MKREDLERLLLEDVPILKGKDIWIWGTGNTFSLSWEGLNRIGFVEKIVGYVDSSKRCWGGAGNRLSLRMN